MTTWVPGPGIYFKKQYVAGLYTGHMHCCATWWLLIDFCSGEERDVDLKSNIRLLEGVAQKQGSAQETGRVLTTWNQNPFLWFLHSHLVCLGRRVDISHQVSLSKKTPTQTAEMLLYSQTDYSAALNMFWEMQGRTLGSNGKEVHFITDRDVKRAGEEDSAQVLLLPLGLPSASLSSLSITWFESAFTGGLHKFRKELLFMWHYY